jgi:lipid II:glycine glycyltransferase (peptidoglycan interpeptide bridge formation enzyme)
MKMVVEVDKIGESEWSELLSGFSDASIYQTWAFGAVRWQEKNLSHLVLKRDGEVVGMAQLRIIRPVGIPLGVAYLRWGPLVQRRGTELDPEIVGAMSSALREEYVRKRGLYLEILPNAFAGSARAEIFQSAFSGFDNKRGISNEQYRTFVLDLSPTLEELRRNLDKKWRNQLNAAERNDLRIVRGDTPEDYRRFCALYSQMWQRKKFQTSVDIDEFGRIQQQLPETLRLRILVCEFRGEPVSGLVCSAIGESGVYLLGATNDEGMKVKASYLLQWAMIQSLKQSGSRYYDLGGIDPEENPGVYHFKSGFSGADRSHIDCFAACESSSSAALVKAGQLLRSGLRQWKARPAWARMAVATR